MKTYTVAIGLDELKRTIEAESLIDAAGAEVLRQMQDTGRARSYDARVVEDRLGRLYVVFERPDEEQT